MKIWHNNKWYGLPVNINKEDTKFFNSLPNNIKEYFCVACALGFNGEQMLKSLKEIFKEE